MMKRRWKFYIKGSRQRYVGQIDLTPDAFTRVFKKLIPSFKRSKEKKEPAPQKQIDELEQKNDPKVDSRQLMRLAAFCSVSALSLSAVTLVLMSRSKNEAILPHQFGFTALNNDADFVPYGRGSLAQNLAASLEFKHLAVQSSPSPDLNPNDRPGVTYIGARYTAGGGIGYPTGYGSLTLQSFFSHKWGTRILPLIDIRGHYFNDRQWAANAGFGSRFLSQSSNFVFGANLFYDYRSYHQNFNQAGLGLEFFTRFLDVRVNGYLPFGRKNRFTDPVIFVDPEEGLFASAVFIQQVEPGVDAEIGTSTNRWFPCRNWNVYGSIGNYFYAAEKCSTNVYGGYLHTGFEFAECFNLEFRTSYDSVYGGKVQGILGITIPFGRRKGSKYNCQHLGMEEVARQPIRRNEIIPLGRKRNEYTSNF